MVQVFCSGVNYTGDFAEGNGRISSDVGKTDRLRAEDVIQLLAKVGLVDWVVVDLD